MEPLRVLGCFLLVLTTQGFLVDNKVCYKELGCFETSHPFTNSIGELPNSPEDVNATLNLYTQKNPTQRQVLRYQDQKSIENSNFNPKNPTKILVHGYLSNGDVEYMGQMTKYFLAKEDMNVIVVDWRKGAHKFYPKAVANTRIVGAIIAMFVNLVIDTYQADPASFHIIGHSLGAHISGYAGSRVENLGRITGLDPAGPLFEGTDIEVRLDPSDAVYVDCIHSDGMPLYDIGLGTKHAWGDIDFYPNGGGDQPGCPEPIEGGLGAIFSLKFSELTTDLSCSHHRAVSYFVESLENENCKMTAHPCSSYKDYLAGLCQDCGDGPCPIMGNDSIKSHRKGKFYIATNANSPFCKSS